MIINTQNFAKLNTGFSAAFQSGFDRVDPQHQRISTEVPSATLSNTYAWLGQFPMMREWLGDRVLHALKAYGWEIPNKPFESSIEVPRREILADQYGIYSPLFQEMGYAAAVHPSELLFPLLTNGFTALGYDGQFFFDTDHPVGINNPASVSNMQAGGGNPWFLIDDSRPLKPLIWQKLKGYEFTAMTKPDDESVFMRNSYRYGVDADVGAGYALWQLAMGCKTTLDATNFDAAVKSMMEFKSDEGRPLGVKPTLLVVGPSNRAAAKTVIESERLASGASNTNFKAVEVLVTPYLA